MFTYNTSEHFATYVKDLSLELAANGYEQTAADFVAAADVITRQREAIVRVLDECRMSASCREQLREAIGQVTVNA